MSSLRVIPRLDIKGPNLVKGVHLEGLRVLGDPSRFARYYYEQGADEFIYQDVVASLYERNSLLDVVTEAAREIFVPLTVGGGLRTLDDISAVLAVGADKVSINTAAIRQPKLIEQAAIKFGSSTIVVAIESIKDESGRWLAYTDNGREHTGVDAVEWAIEAEKLGAGEILATSVDRDGTGEGYEIEFTKAIADAVSIPVIAHGGPGDADHVAEVVTDAGVDAVAIASLFHYDAAKAPDVSGSSSDQGNKEFLKSGRDFKRVTPTSIPELKRQLIDRGISCREEFSPS